MIKYIVIVIVFSFSTLIKPTLGIAEDRVTTFIVPVPAGTKYRIVQTQNSNIPHKVRYRRRLENGQWEIVRYDQNGGYNVYNYPSSNENVVWKIQVENNGNPGTWRDSIGTVKFFGKPWKTVIIRTDDSVGPDTFQDLIIKFERQN